MKLKMISEGLKDNKESVKDLIVLIRELKKETDDKNTKKDLEKLLDKMRKLRDDMPDSELSLVTSVFKKILMLPLRFFGI